MSTNNAPILRSGALQKALALAPVRRAPTATAAFASTLAQATASVRPSAITPQKNDGVPFQDMITAAAQKYGVRPALLAGLVKAESNFNPNAQSGVGAKGLTQLMDATARGLGVTNSLDPAQSLDGGAKFLGGLLKQFKGDQSLALAAYNASPGAVQKSGGNPPPQNTQPYVPKELRHPAQSGR